MSQSHNRASDERQLLLIENKFNITYVTSDNNFFDFTKSGTKVSDSPAESWLIISTKNSARQLAPLQTNRQLKIWNLNKYKRDILNIYLQFWYQAHVGGIIVQIMSTAMLLRWYNTGQYFIMLSSLRCILLSMMVWAQMVTHYWMPKWH
jgi:hypothetical protein